MNRTERMIRAVTEGKQLPCCGSYLDRDIENRVFRCKCGYVKISERDIGECGSPESLFKLIGNAFEAAKGVKKLASIDALLTMRCPRCDQLWTNVQSIPLKYECLCGVVVHQTDLWECINEEQLARRIDLLIAKEGGARRCDTCMGLGEKFVLGEKRGCSACSNKGWVSPFHDGKCYHCRGTGMLKRFKGGRHGKAYKNELAGDDVDFFEAPTDHPCEYCDGRGLEGNDPAP